MGNACLYSKLHHGSRQYLNSRGCRQSLQFSSVMRRICMTFGLGRRPFAGSQSTPGASGARMSLVVVAGLLPIYSSALREEMASKMASPKAVFVGIGV